MKQVVCAVRDSAVNAFIRPFFVPAVGAAMRGFADEVNRADSEMCKHPDDYELYELGSFDDETGRFLNWEDGPRLISRGKDVRVVPRSTFKEIGHASESSSSG